MAKLHTSEKGLTLVELLAALTLMGIISVIIVSYLTSGMNSFRKVNEEINVHDEANYVMRRFENEILEATNVKKVESTDPLCSDTENCQLITITKTVPVKEEKQVTASEENKVILGFKDQLAVVNEEVLSSNVFKPNEDSPEPTITVIEHPDRSEWYVQIKLIVGNKKMEFQVELESQIPFVKVD